jgi:predicted DNA-binding transcriptional regulator AlpA
VAGIAPIVRLIEIAEILGVSKQRAHQLAGERGFPKPVDRDGRGRLWSRREVAAWAKAWRRERPWR